MKSRKLTHLVDDLNKLAADTATILS